MLQPKPHSVQVLQLADMACFQDFMDMCMSDSPWHYCQKCQQLSMLHARTGNALFLSSCRWYLPLGWVMHSNSNNTCHTMHNTMQAKCCVLFRLLNWLCFVAGGIHWKGIVMIAPPNQGSTVAHQLSNLPGIGKLFKYVSAVVTKRVYEQLGSLVGEPRQTMHTLHLHVLSCTLMCQLGTVTWNVS